MRYQLEYHLNPDLISVHTDKVITRKSTEHFWGDDCESKEDRSPLVRDLFTMDGTNEILLHRNTVSITKGKVFQWEEMVSRIIFILQLHLDPYGEFVEVAQPMRQHIDNEGFRRDTPTEGTLNRSRLFPE
ncbi:MAG: NifU N-terminal domain-containing protein [Candidatus Taylorbacteria bacterium]|nr:NifU N-terminal domain-containing protein [Candidatus Taylorbacteria bacterium]